MPSLTEQPSVIVDRILLEFQTHFFYLYKCYTKIHFEENVQKCAAIMCKFMFIGHTNKVILRAELRKKWIKVGSYFNDAYGFQLQSI